MKHTSLPLALLILSAVCRQQAPAADPVPWSLDPAQLSISDAPLRGRLPSWRDLTANPPVATLSGQTLTITGSDTTADTYTFLIADRRLEVGPGLEGLTLRIEPSKPTRSDIPTSDESSVQISWGGFHSFRYGRDNFRDSFAMVLEFGTMKGGTLPAGIHLCLPDEGKSFLAGRFEITGLKLAAIEGTLDIPPAINEKFLFIGSIGPAEKEPLWTGGADIEISPAGQVRYATVQAGGPPGIITIVKINNERKGAYQLCGGQPGWHLILMGGGEREAAPPPLPPSKPGFPPMPAFHMPQVIPEPRLYAAHWVEMKDSKTIIDRPLQCAPARLGTLKVQAPGAREGTIISFLPLLPDGTIPVPDAHCVSPYLRMRVKNGTTPNYQLPEGSYEFLCLGDRQMVKIEAGKTKTLKFDL